MKLFAELSFEQGKFSRGETIVEESHRFFGSHERAEYGVEHAVWEASGCIAAELRMALQVSDAFLVFKNLSTPKCSIVAISKTIADDGDKIIQVVFSGNGIGMGAVMLDGDERNIERFGEFSSVERCLIFRMCVTE